MKIYLAGPVVAGDDTKKLVDSVYQKLIAKFPTDDVYRPGLHKVPNAWGITMEMWGQCVFTMDVIAIDDCDWVVLCNFGREGATAGTAWECGYAFAKQKKILVVNMPGSEKSSLMITGCAANKIELAEFLNADNFDNIFVERGKLAAAQVLD